VSIENERRVGLVSGEETLECLTDGRHFVAVESALAVGRRKARCDEQSVALSEGDIEPVGEMQHHLAARARAAGLDEAQVPRRDSGSRRQLELTQVPACPPLTQQLSGVMRMCCDFAGHCRASAQA